MPSSTLNQERNVREGEHFFKFLNVISSLIHTVFTVSISRTAARSTQLDAHRCTGFHESHLHDKNLRRRTDATRTLQASDARGGLRRYLVEISNSIHVRGWPIRGIVCRKDSNMLEHNSSAVRESDCQPRGPRSSAPAAVSKLKQLRSPHTAGVFSEYTLKPFSFYAWCLS